MRYVFRDYTLDTDRYELRRAGIPVSLGPKPFALLTYLLQHRDRAVAKEELLAQLWPQQFVSESVLTSCMLVVRQALGDSGRAQQLIQTVRGRGYRFMLPVEEQTEPEGALTPVSSVPQVTPLATEPQQLTGLAPHLVGPPALCTSLDSLPGVPFDFPPRQTPTSRTPTLPGQLTSLIGREREGAAVGQLLQRAEVRLLTLTGPGGVGKTRLGLQVAADLRQDFAHGVYFVPLATICDPALVLPTIARPLGVPEHAEQVPLDSLKAHLRDKQILLVLDNFEQVLAAALALVELLTACPMLKLLVTSREVLRLSGEYEFPVPPLPVPDPRHLPPAITLSQYAAVALFLQRAQAVEPDFAITHENASAVAEICVRLDGLPLAIELAAARMKLFSPRALLARLARRLAWLHAGARDAPPRHQTLRHAIAWSYDLLAAHEQARFRHLAVFVGGCTLEAAAMVCQAMHDPAAGLEAAEAEAVEGIASLVDKSLLQSEEGIHGEPRFRMLETIREFGLECLVACGEASAVQRAHASYYLALAEAAEAQLSGPDQAVWLERLEAEHDNFRAALRWAEESGAVEEGLRLAGALCQFWLARSHLHEGQAYLARLVPLARTSMPTPARAKVLTGAGHLAHNQGDYTTARSLFEESLTLWREIGNKRGIASALNDLGWIAWRQGDYAVARALSAESLALWQDFGEMQGVATALTNLGWIAQHRGDYAAAWSLFEESLALRRALEDKRGVAFALMGLGWARSRQGAYSAAAALLEEAIGLFRDVWMKQLLAFASSLLAEVTCAQGEAGQAALLLEGSVRLFRDIGDKYGLAMTLRILGTVMQTQGDVTHATALYEESLALRRALGDLHGIAECLEGLADVAVAQQHLHQAARLLGAAEALRAKLDAPLSPREQARVVRHVSTVRTRLGDAAFGAAWAAGQTTALAHTSASNATCPKSP